MTAVLLEQVVGMDMQNYTEIRAVFGNVLPATFARAMALELVHSRDWFIEEFQRKAKLAGAETYTLAELLAAVNNSERRFKQYPVDRKKVKDLAYSVFIEDRWLMRSPVVANIAGETQLYIVGGRHRVYAIASAIAEICYYLAKGDDSIAQENYEMILSSHIECDRLVVPDVDTLASLVSADNQSRRVRGAEEAHIKAQLLGASAEGTDDVFELAATSQRLTPKEQVAIAAQAFTRRSHPRLKPQTLQVIGERVAAFILFDVLPGQRLSNKAVATRELEEAKEKMSKAYDVLCEVVENMDVVAKNASDIAMKVIQAISSKSSEQGEELTEEAVSMDGAAPKKRGRKKQAPQPGDDAF